MFPNEEHGFLKKGNEIRAIQLRSKQRRGLKSLPIQFQFQNTLDRVTSAWPGVVRITISRRKRRRSRPCIFNCPRIKKQIIGG